MKPCKLRHEQKHFINGNDAVTLSKRLENTCKYDSFGDSKGRYTVNSLYFDNYDDKVLREKLNGLKYREKFRLRYYGCDTGFIRLEKKSRVNELVGKESFSITKEQAQSLLEGEYSFLLTVNDPLAAEFYAKIAGSILRPKSIVTYERQSFVYKPGNVRVTIDSSIRTSTVVKDFFAPKPNFVSHSGIVLEIKYDEFLPQIIADFCQLGFRRRQNVSKYAVSRAALNFY